jgi:ubiquinone/menaquinone biosynthesis C-methylase UbiE
MVDSISRFNTRVDSYAKYRPTYPHVAIDELTANCGLTEDGIVADVGSGTGILSEMFLKRGNTVFGVEPNAQMRATAEALMSSYPQFKSVDGTAEATTLEAGSVDLVTAAQAFHWFDRARARLEFTRILKPNAWVALLWNERRLDSSPFLRAYEQLMLQYGTDYEKVRHENVTRHIQDFFAPQRCREESFDNIQNFDFDGLKGRVLSSSYAPGPDHPNFDSMMTALRKIFDTYQRSGTIAFEYDTRLYYGQLKTG